MEVKVTPGVESLKLSWEPSTAAGGWLVHYRPKASPAVSWSTLAPLPGSATGCVITGLPAESIEWQLRELVAGTLTTGMALPEGKPPSPSRPLVGLNTGVEPLDVQCTVELGAKQVRLEVPASNLGSSVFAQAVAGYHAAGVAVVALVSASGSMITEAEVHELDRVAGLPGVVAVELMNETSYPAQYGETGITGAYRARARTYAARAALAAEVLDGFPLWVQASDGGTNSSAWVDEMFTAVPGLSKHVTAWTLHPYSSSRTVGAPDNWGIPLVQRTVTDLAKHDDTTTPFVYTEWGETSTPAGTGLSNGWALTWTQATQIAEAHLPKVLAAAGPHLVLGTFVYQVRDEKPLGATTDWEAYFGAVQREGTPKGTYTELIKRLLAG